MSRRLRFLMLWCGVLACALGPALHAAENAPARGFTLEIEVANPQGGFAQLFYDIGQWYSVHDSARVEIPAGDTLQPYRFAIPPQPIRRLRFDAADGAARVRFGRMRLLGPAGNVLAEFGPERLVPMHSIEQLELHDGVATVVTAADDPMLLIARPLQRESAQALGRTPLTAPVALSLAIFVAMLIALAVAGAGLAVARGGGMNSKRALWFGLGAFCAVAGARLHALKLYSRPMPFWDDWKTGAIDLLMPLRDGCLDWQTLFLPHGEHRILVTRLITLGGSILNGEWDPRVAMFVSALFFAAAVALLAMALLHARRAGVGLALVLLALACLPFDWRNLFWSDQSQMFALVLLAACTLAIAAAPRIDALLFAAAAAGAGVSLFTMGSGFVAPGIALVVCVARARCEPANARRLWLLAAAFAVATAAGALLYRDAPFQSSDYARTWAQFWPAFVARASWPLPPRMIWAALVWLPWVTLGVIVAREILRRDSAALRPLTWVALGLGAWALANVIGLAHGRPTDAAPFDPKYYTVMSTSVAAAVLCAGALAARAPRGRALAIVATVAALVTAGALYPLGKAGLEASRRQFTDRLANDDLVRPFLATGDPTVLRRTPWHQLPYWNGAELADLLDDPRLQPWLAAPLRAALARRPNSPVSGTQTPGPLTTGVRTAMKAGPFLFALGILLLGGVTLRVSRERPRLRA